MPVIADDRVAGTTPPILLAAAPASVRFSTASSSCRSGVVSGTRLPYNALNARQPSCSPMETATSRLSRNSAERPGHDTRPRSPAGMSPAKKLSPTRRTPASRSAPTKSSTSASGGTATLHGHQNSTAVKPAARAAAGRCRIGNSVNRIEQLTSNRAMDRPSAWCACLAATRTTPDCLSGHRTVQPAIGIATAISRTLHRRDGGERGAVACG